MNQFLVGLALAALIGAVSYWRSLLSRSGAVGAVVLGTAIMGLGGWRWGVLLVWFFLSASLLSKYRADQKQKTAEKFDKGHRRDLGQVIANGGIGGLLALAAWWQPHPLWLAAYIGALAAVTADTWATETGTLSRQPPRLVTTGRVVPPGTSGAVTLLGSAASAAGALATGLVGGVLFGQLTMWQGVAAGLVGGLAGAFFDSLLGATVQGIYLSPVTGQETEKISDRGQPTTFLRGWRWLTNDRVNLLASVVGAGVGAGVGLFLNIK